MPIKLVINDVSIIVVRHDRHNDNDSHNNDDDEDDHNHASCNYDQ